MIEVVRDAIASVPGPVLIIEDGSQSAARRSGSLPRTATRWVIGAERPVIPPSWQGVALLVHDRQSLRRVVSALPQLGTSARIWCWVDDCGGWPPSLIARPEWPRLKSSSIRTTPLASLTTVEFAGRVAAREVLIGVARGSSPQRNLWAGQPVLGAAGAHAALWAPASPDTLTDDNIAELVSPERPQAPDAVLLGSETSMDTPDGVHPTTGRRVEQVTVRGLVPWAELDPGSPGCGTATRVFDPLSVPPVDECILNPVGFERAWSHGVVAVEPSLLDPERVTVQLPNGRREIDLHQGLTDSDVKAMRCLQGVELGWRGGHGPQAYARLVAALAMAGVPIASTVVPRWAATLLDHHLVAELSAPASLGEQLAREERSVRLRRAAHRGHSMAGWRRRLARASGLPVPREPRVSILLATRRPDMVAFALRQVAKQRHAGGEVILATHGFEPDNSVHHMLDDVPSWDLRVMPQPVAVPFGSVLNRAAERATGDVLLKMDDDDWYGPEFVADLLLARRYSGAEIVGTPAEFIFLSSLWATVRRPDYTERFSTIVAGGTIMIGRTAFAEVGGFRPVQRAVDAGILAAVREGGGGVYRAQGLGYLLRREAGGHTWDPGTGYFIHSSRVAAQWHGFRPSAELGVAQEDRPLRATQAVEAGTGGRS